MFEIGQLTRLPLGYVGENGTRTISIDMKAWLDEYPGALIMIQVIRPVDHYKYPAAYTKTDGVIHWTVDGAEVMYAGKGLAQIALYNPDTKQEYKSRVVGTIVAESLDGFNDIMLEETDPASKWVNRVLEAAESAEASKNDAANSKEEAAAAVAIVAMQKNEALIAIQNEGAAQVVSVNDAGTQQAQFVEAKGEEVLGKIPEDYTELSKNVATLTKDIARNTAPAIIPTATGSMVTIMDGAARPAVELISHIEPVETGSGEKGPNNPWTISGWDSVTAQGTGKNLLPVNHINTNQHIAGAVEMAYLPAGNYMLSADVTKYPGDSATNTRMSCNVIYTDGHIETFSTEFDTGNAENDGVTRRKQYPFQIRADKRVQNIAFYLLDFSVAGSARNAKAENAQLEQGNVATSFEPYQGQTLTASLPETVYGGDVYWHTGKLKSNALYTHLDNDSFDWVNYESYNNDTSMLFAMPSLAMRHADRLKIFCTHFPTITGNPQQKDGEAIATHPEEIYSNYLYIRINRDRLSTQDVAGFKEWLSNNNVCAVLYKEEDTVYQLTTQQLSTLKGINNVWSSTGDTTLSYVADTELWATRKFAAIAAAMLAN